MTTFRTQQWVPFDVEQVFLFFANPHNLLLLMPEEQQARLESLEIVPPAARESGTQPGTNTVAAGTGTEILISFRPVPWMPVRVRWLARIGDFVWNSHFCDEQVRGPFAQFRHCHRMRAERLSGAWGTLVIDEIQYSLPFGIAGLLVSGLVQERLESLFAERQARLTNLIAAS